MSPQPTGRLVTTDAGRDLVLTRTFTAPIDDVWASITESDRTAKWFASWTGDAAPGATIKFRMELEEGAPESDLEIVACEAPHLLSVRSEDEFGSWFLEARLDQDGDDTTLVFTHHLDAGVDIGSIGPGWEYYLDALVASRDDAPRPEFDDYFPAQQAYFEALDPS